MKLITAGLTSAILATGLVGSVAAYRSQVGEIESVERSTAAPPTATAEAGPPRTKVRWAPCKDGSRLEKGACVTEVIRTVVIPAATQPSLPSNAWRTSVRTGIDRDEDDSHRDDGGEAEDDGDDGHDADDEDGHHEDGHDEDGHDEDGHD